MSNIIRRQMGKVSDLGDSLSQKIGGVENTLDYITRSTTKSLGRNFLGDAFDTKSIKQLGKEIKTDNEYRIYGSIYPTTQVRRGRVCITPNVLSDSINSDVTSAEDKIEVRLCDNGLVKYGIQTTEGLKYVTLKQMNDETRDRVSQRVSDSIDNVANDYARKTKLASIMGGSSLTYSFTKQDGTKHTDSFSSDDIYDLMRGEYHTKGHKWYSKSSVLDVIRDKIQDGLLHKLQKTKKISTNISWSDFYDTIMSADISSLTRQDINASEKLYKKNYGVQRLVSSGDISSSFDDIARAMGRDPEAIKKSQETNQEANQTSAESQEVSESSEQFEDVQEVLSDFLINPSNYSESDIKQQLALLMANKKISLTEWTNYLGVVDSMQKEGRLGSVSQGNIQKNTTKEGVTSLAVDGQMKKYFADPKKYTSNDVETYLANAGANGQVTEKTYDKYLQKMKNIDFKDVNVHAKAA